MFLTVDEAIQQVDLPREALLKNLKTGKLAGFETLAGEWLIDAAELLSKFAYLLRSHDQPVLRVVIQKAENSSNVLRLQEMLEAERERSAELRTERDRWAMLAERLALPSRQEDKT